FRIPLLMIDIPFEHYLLYGCEVVLKNPRAATLAVVASVSLIWIAARLSQQVGRFWLTTILLIVLAGLFWIGSLGGILTAGSDFRLERENDYEAYPRLSLLFKDNVPKVHLERLADIATTDCGRLVIFSKDRLFVIRPIQGASAAQLDSFVIPMDQVAL